MISMDFFGGNSHSLFTFPETNSKFAPENRPGPKRKRSYSNHPCSGAMIGFSECNCFWLMALVDGDIWTVWIPILFHELRDFLDLFCWTML